MSGGTTSAPKPDPGAWLVRGFSDDFRNQNPSDSLGRGLGTRVTVDHERERRIALARDQWNLFLLEGREMAIRAVPDEEVFLLDQSRKLYAAWKKFCDRLPDDRRREMNANVPSIMQLQNCVEKASQSWKEGREGTTTGRLKEIFSGLCNNFRDHSKIVSMVPTNDKYVSLLTGALSAIAQASINHKEIATGVADGIEDLARDMAFWNSLLSEYGDIPAMQRCIIELYVVVFEFLTEIFTEWSRSSWKRFVISFDERAFQKLFGDRRARISAIELRMKRLADLEFQRTMKQRVNQMEAGLQAIMQGQDHSVQQQQNVLVEAQHSMLLKLGNDVQLLLSQSLRREPIEAGPAPGQLSLTSTPAHGMPLERSSDAPLDLYDSSNLLLDAPKENGGAALVSSGQKSGESLSARHFQRLEVLDCLKIMAEEYGRLVQEMVKVSGRASNTLINPVVGDQIAEWTRSAEVAALWIQGPHDVPSPSQNALTAVCLVALSNQSQIPCISYFCSFSAGPLSARRKDSPQDMLEDMLKSFIIQVVLLLPDQLKTTVDLSRERFERLTAEEIDFSQTLALLQDLLSLAPPYLQCIVEGAQLLEDREDLRHTDRLQRILRELISRHESIGAESSNIASPEHSNDGQSPIRKVTKVYFTTDGQVDALARLADENLVREVFYAEESDQRGAPEGRTLMPHWTEGIE